MLQRLSKHFYKYSTPFITIASVVVFLLFSVTILPAQSAAAEAYSGSEGTPDLSFLYTPSDLYQMADQFGSGGRIAYVKARFTFDLIFPIIYGVFLVTTISFLLDTLYQPSRWQRQLNLIPVAGVLFDLLENSAASIVITRFPDLSPISASLAPIFTLVKWIFVGGSFFLLILCLILRIIKKIKKYPPNTKKRE